jgi:sugar-specific transcriptional regulator TrmB
MIEGLAVLEPGKVQKYSAANPVVLGDKLENRIEEEYNEQKKTINKAILVLKKKFDYKLTNGANNENFPEFIQILKNRDQIHRKKIQLCAEAETEILGFSKPPFATMGKKLLKGLNDAFEDVVSRGVKLRSIHQLPASKANRISLFKWINKNYEPESEELRLSEDIPTKVAIFDSKIVLITLEYPILGENLLTGLLIKHPGLARGQKEMFESYWNKGIDYYELDGRKYYLDKDRALKDMQDRGNT